MSENTKIKHERHDSEDEKRSKRSTSESSDALLQTRRLYEAERVPVPWESSGGLLTSRELRYLRHADRLDPVNRTSLRTLLETRIETFLGEEWPLIEESYPELAARVRERLDRRNPPHSRP